jgi:uncharacterized protein YndB with AHSA1/START domain
MHTVQEQTTVHSTFVIEKHYAATPERIFAAFADPVKRRRWNAEGPGREVEVFTMDFRIGGHDRTEYRFAVDGPLRGAVIVNESRYQEIVPNRRIVMVYTMAFGEHPFSASQTTFELIPTGHGTDLIFTEQAAFFENADGPARREEGWRKLLDKLANELGD